MKTKHFLVEFVIFLKLTDGLTRVAFFVLRSQTLVYQSGHSYNNSCNTMVKYVSVTFSFYVEFIYFDCVYSTSYLLTVFEDRKFFLDFNIQHCSVYGTERQ